MNTSGQRIGRILGISSAVGLLALLAMFSMSGHGPYIVPAVLVPFAMLMTLAFSPGFLLFFFVGFVQFPIYGLIVFLPQSRSARIAAALAVFVVHAIAVIVVFANEIP